MDLFLDAYMATLCSQTKSPEVLAKLATGVDLNSLVVGGAGGYVAGKATDSKQIDWITKLLLALLVLQNIGGAALGGGAIQPTRMA